MKYFLSQLGISILGGIIAGIIVTYIIDRTLKKIAPSINLSKVLKKEIFVGIILFTVLIIYMILVAKGILPKPILGDPYVVIEYPSGKEVEVLPDGTRRYTGRVAEVPKVEWQKDK